MAWQLTLGRNSEIGIAIGICTDATPLPALYGRPSSKIRSLTDQQATVKKIGAALWTQHLPVWRQRPVEHR